MYSNDLVLPLFPYQNVFAQDASLEVATCCRLSAFSATLELPHPFWCRIELQQNENIPAHVKYRIANVMGRRALTFFYRLSVQSDLIEIVYAGAKILLIRLQLLAAFPAYTYNHFANTLIILLEQRSFNALSYARHLIY